MRRFPVGAERLAVIGREDDERVPRGAGGQNRVEDGRQRRIHRRHFSGVGIAREPCGQGAGRRIWEMRVVQMNPAEPAIAGLS